MSTTDRTAETLAAELARHEPNLPGMEAHLTNAYLMGQSQGLSTASLLVVVQRLRTAESLIANLTDQVEWEYEREKVDVAVASKGFVKSGPVTGVRGWDSHNGTTVLTNAEGAIVDRLVYADANARGAEVLGREVA